jgi:hypothetical protein
MENAMFRFASIGAAALSLTFALALPAAAPAAQSTNRQPIKRHVRVLPTVPPPAIYNFGDPSLPIENALRWGYSQGYQHYPSGFGGLYGDGRYPGNTIANRNYPTWW